MKHFYNLLCTLLLAVLCSCSETIYYNGNTPNELDAFNLKNHVKSVVETEYTVKFVNRVARKNKLDNEVRRYFDINGRLTLVNYYHQEFPDEYSYDEFGKFLGVNTMQNPKVTYNEAYDITKIEYNIDDFNCVKTYKYDKDGHIIDEEFKYSSPEYTEGIQTTTVYENSVRKSINVLNAEYQTIKSECDDKGNVILEETYELEEKKPSLKATYVYEYDEHGNWTNRIKREKYTKSITERKITYYTDEEVALAGAQASKSDTEVSSYSEDEGLIGNYINNVSSRLTKRSFYRGPSQTLLIVVICFTVLISLLLFIRYKDRLGNFTGFTRSNGMKRIWVYNSQPYSRVGLYLFIVLCAFLISLVVLFIFGGATWLVFWILKICLIVLIWVGIIAAILGGLLIWGGSFYGLLIGIPGVIIWIYSEDMEEAGNNLVESGFRFMNDLNMFEWSYNLFVHYWDVLLAVFLLPMLLFLLFALVIIIITSILNLSELLITKIYNVRRPCPVCGSTKGYHYMVKGKAHPVPLRPGMYGILHHTSAVNYKQLPTMLFNGKGKLNRQCVSCGSKVTVKSEDGVANSYGTDIHIGVVGHRSSGKSYLLYSGLSQLQEANPNKIQQIDSDNDTVIASKMSLINRGGDIPPTDDLSRYRAIQLMLKDKFRVVPYHLFFYDVAGEKFNASSTSHLSAMDFYSNVDSILFVIDPLMVDFTGIPANDDLLQWLESKASKVEKNNITSTFTILKDILDKASRKSKKIDFTFVCTKMDLGYFEAMNFNSETITPKEIEQFICRDMSLNNIVNAAKAEFKSVNFAAVSAMTKDKSSLIKLFSNTLRQKGIKL